MSLLSFFLSVIDNEILVPLYTHLYLYVAAVVDLAHELLSKGPETALLTVSLLVLCWLALAIGTILCEFGLAALIRLGFRRSGGFWESLGVIIRTAFLLPVALTIVYAKSIYLAFTADAKDCLPAVLAGPDGVFELLKQRPPLVKQD